MQNKKKEKKRIVVIIYYNKLIILMMITFNFKHWRLQVVALLLSASYFRFRK